MFTRQGYGPPSELQLVPKSIKIALRANMASRWADLHADPRTAGPIWGLRDVHSCCMASEMSGVGYLCPAKTFDGVCVIRCTAVLGG